MRMGELVWPEPMPESRGVDVDEGCAVSVRPEPMPGAAYEGVGDVEAETESRAAVWPRPMLQAVRMDIGGVVGRGACHGIVVELENEGAEGESGRSG